MTLEQRVHLLESQNKILIEYVKTLCAELAAIARQQQPAPPRRRPWWKRWS